jgi:sugar lactone lactonase YvrE
VTIDYTSVGASRQLTLTISPYTAITQPATVLQNFKTNIEAALANLQQHVNSPVIHLNADYLATIKYMKEVITENFNQLTSEEQLQLAYFLQNNSVDAAAFELDELNAANYRINSMETDPGERLWKVALGFRNSTIKTITFFSVGAGLAYIPSPDLFTKLLAFGSFVTGTVYLSDALSKVEEIGSLKGLADQLTDFSNRQYGEDAQELVLFKEADKKVAFRASYRNLIKTDQASTIPVIADVFAAEKSVSKMHADILSAYNKITSWFKKAFPAFPAYLNPIKTTATRINYPLAGHKLVLKNVSDSAVKVTYTAADTVLIIKASSKSLTADRQFTFDVSYTDAKLGVTITQKINAIYKFNKTGIVVAGGNGYGAAANQLNAPTDLFMDAAGSLYLSDRWNYRVQKWAAGATTGTTVAGGNGEGTDSNKLKYPSGVFVNSSGQVYVNDVLGYNIMRWAPGASYGFKMLALDKFEPYGSNANQLNQPGDIWVDGSGNIYVCDVWNHRIQKWAPGATAGVTVAGGNGAGSAANQLSRPEGIFLDASGNLYIADNENYRIQKWAPGATSGVTVAGGNGKGYAANQIVGPTDIRLDASGNMYIADAAGNRVIKWLAGATSGTDIIKSELGAEPHQIWGPVSILLDGKGSILVLEKGNNRVTKWSID